MHSLYPIFVYIFFVFCLKLPNMSQQRKLAAIMFTDIVGYTAMMQSDETQAMAMRNRHREVFEKLSPLLEADEVLWLKKQCRTIA